VPARRSILLAVAACSYVLLHVLTLTRSPVPYFDDSFFASVADTFTRTGELRLAAGPLWIDGPVYLYGPAYFLAQRVVFEHFGFGLLQSRILGLVFGIGVVMAVFASLRQAGLPRRVALWTCMLLALDPTLNLSLHSGRMDGMALFLILVSFTLLLKSGKSDTRAKPQLCAASGVFAALGVLTTPRPAYLVVLMGVILLVRWCVSRTRQEAVQLLSWSVPLIGLYAIWIWYAFGSLDEMARYYRSLAGTYVGGRFAVRMIHYPLLAILVAVSGLRLLSRPRVRFDELVFFALSGVAAFYLLGINPPNFGTVYSVFTIPLIYMALASLTSALSEEGTWGGRGAIMQRGVFAFLLVFNGAALCARTALELLQWDSRDPVSAEVVARQVIPPGSRVIGDDKYYFAVRKAGSDFQYAQRGGTLDERVAYHRDVYGFEYLITNEAETSDVFQAYAGSVQLVKVASIRAGQRPAVADWLSGLARRVRVGAPLVPGYEGAVFARARPDEELR
jgi:Dolichyl-phosphate-mannose-protein mannosyltransferase